MSFNLLRGKILAAPRASIRCRVYQHQPTVASSRQHDVRETMARSAPPAQRHRLVFSESQSCYIGSLYFQLLWSGRAAPEENVMTEATMAADGSVTLDAHAGHRPKLDSGFDDRT